MAKVMANIPVTESVTQQPAPRTHLPAVDHALKAQAIQKERAVRAVNNLAATAQLFSTGLDSDSLKELLLLQQSVWSRLTALRTSWVKDWVGWARYADQIKGANTLSKLFEMESNIFSQAAQIMGGQITSLVTLQENLEVDYSYLVNEMLAERQKPKCLKLLRERQAP